MTILRRTKEYFIFNSFKTNTIDANIQVFLYIKIRLYGNNHAKMVATKIIYKKLRLKS